MRQRPFSSCVALLAAAPVLASDGLDSIAGRALFERIWLPAPSSTTASDGLGPLFNARSCSACHKDGGGARVIEDGNGHSIVRGAVVRLGTADGTRDPYYGEQLQTEAILGLEPEARVDVLPELAIALNGPALSQGVSAGIRLAPPLFGRALFDDVPDEEILGRADPDDKNHDGIRGRANITAHGVGRFGWKAARVSLDDQIAQAFAIDLGLSSPKVPNPGGDCTPRETACLAMRDGESPATDGREVSSQVISLVASYLASLPASKPQTSGPGEQLFATAGCSNCHVPELKGTNGQPIRAFSDLLLHDMGVELDDGVGEAGIKSSEWRTAPLIGSSPSSSRRYLHNGAALSIGEAIEKHGGEAAASREAFRAMTAKEQHDLIDYVGRL